MRWQPRGFNQFEYEIFAFGGIDVNYVLGSNHRYANQHEIAFPGGIRREFIRSAREYDADGRLVRRWLNMNFDNAANGADHSPPFDMYPTPSHRSVVPIVIYPIATNQADQPQPESDHELRRRRSAEDAGDTMHTDGDVVPDTTLDTTPYASRACFLDPSRNGRAYFFYANKYVVIDVNPSTTDDTIALGPKLLVDNWPSLMKAGFGEVDAVLPNPSNSDQMYFFSMEQYVLVNVQLGTSYIL